MYIPKKYGKSQVRSCPFCNRQATVKNQQKVPVCEKHRCTPFPDVRCTCKSFFDLKEGPYGVYFSCSRCGNKNFQQVLEILGMQGIGIHSGTNNAVSTPKTNNAQSTPTPSPAQRVTKEKKEITISSDDVEWF